MSKPILWITCGLSGSGKSTIAAQIVNENPNTVIVSSDAIHEELTGDYTDQEHNEEVFKIFHDRIRKNLEQKRNVIADATNLTMKSRRAIMMKIRGLDVRKVCIVIPKPFEQCKIDNRDREHPVPDEVLDKQIRRFQIPFKEEGFEEIIVKKCHVWNEYKMTNFEMFMLMLDYDQKNPYHKQTLDNHCMHTYHLFVEKYPSSVLILQEYVSGFTMGAKLHDIGKIMVQSFDEDGVAHYLNHSEIGSYFVLSQMELPLPWTTDILLDCCFLINYHMMPFDWTTDKTKQRWKERFGEYKYKVLLDFHECDIAR